MISVNKIVELPRLQNEIRAIGFLEYSMQFSQNTYNRSPAYFSITSPVQIYILRNSVRKSFQENAEYISSLNSAIDILQNLWVGIKVLEILNKFSMVTVFSRSE